MRQIASALTGLDLLLGRFCWPSMMPLFVDIYLQPASIVATTVACAMATVSQSRVPDGVVVLLRFGSSRLHCETPQRAIKPSGYLQE